MGISVFHLKKWFTVFLAPPLPTPSPIPECGGILYEDTGLITAPTDDGNYTHSVTCEWEIVVGYGKRVVVHFSEDAEIEDDNRTCSFDSISVSGTSVC